MTLDKDKWLADLRQEIKDANLPPEEAICTEMLALMGAIILSAYHKEGQETAEIVLNSFASLSADMNIQGGAEGLCDLFDRHKEHCPDEELETDEVH